MTEYRPHRLSIIGYWSTAGDPPEESRGFPDPHDLKADWDDKDLRATLSHLRRGKAFRAFLGASSCRICGRRVGGREFTDGEWAWPEGLIHYVETHRVRLPESFVSVARGPRVPRPSWLASLELEWSVTSGLSSSPVDGCRPPACVVDDLVWLDWAAGNTPARPHVDAISLEEARDLCRSLSHGNWTADVQEVAGRWCIRSGDSRMYLQKCSATALEQSLLSVRPPDPEHILDADQANSIAAEYDGSWGAARVVFTSDEAWLVWVKRPEGQWPTNEDRETILGEVSRFGAVTFRIQRDAKSFPIPPVDEGAWRRLLACEREEAMNTPGPSTAERLGKALGVSVVSTLPGGHGDVQDDDRP